MGSIQRPQRPDRILESIASKVAFEQRLPWRLEELRSKAREAYDTVEPPSEALGLPRAQARRRMLEGIKMWVEEEARRMDQPPHDQSRPTSSQIETALGAFSAEEWRDNLIGTFGQADAQALLSFIRQAPAEMKQRIGTRKVERIEAYAIMRDSALWLKENRSKMVPISDVYWAFALRDMALDANVRGKGHPAQGQPMAERAKAPHIARRLSKRDNKTGREMNVSAYMVEQWWKRWADLFTVKGADDAQSRADLLLDPDCWALIRDTTAFKEYMEAQHRHEK